MNKDDFEKKSWELCDKALERLRSEKIAPLPNNYQKEFDALLEKLSYDEFTGKIYQEQNTFTHVNQYLEIAQLALQAFVQSNQEISEVMHEYTDKMTPSHGYEADYLTTNCVQIVDNLAQLDTQMTDALLRAHDQIAQLSSKIEHLTEENTIDTLTKFYNRKELFKDLNLITQGLHYDSNAPECHLLMIDLDDFKTINDTNSHIAGDKTLIYIAKTISTIIRNTDKAYRLGGDEFVIILNRSTLEAAQKIAEKIRATIEKARLFYENKEIRITVSIGVSKVSGHDIESSLLRADKALYAAKNKNKNQVVTISLEE